MGGAITSYRLLRGVFVVQVASGCCEQFLSSEFAFEIEQFCPRSYAPDDGPLILMLPMIQSVDILWDAIPLTMVP